MDSPAPVVQVGDLLASKYRVERVLGQGGMGVVVAARHEQLGFPVALKFMLPTALGDASMKERFLREARAAGSLRSEHVARVMDFGTLDDGAPYIVMEFLQGSDLQDVLAQVGSLPPHEAVEYVIQACKGMAEAHAQGIVHRDLKPQNLFLTRRPDGTPLVKVLDFGISKLVGPETSLSVTSSSAMMGSPLYMAPEQVRSSKKVDSRADIYSLGVILYQLVTGHLPIPAETLGELFEALFTRPTPAPRSHRPELAPELDAIIMRCLAKTPDERFENVGRLAAALLPFTDVGRSLSSMPGLSAAPGASSIPAVTQALHGSGFGPTTTSGAVSEARPEVPGMRRRARVRWIAAAGGVVAVAAAGLVTLGHKPPPTAIAASATSVPPPAIPPTAAPSASIAPAASVATLQPVASSVATQPSATTPGPVHAATAPLPGGRTRLGASLPQQPAVATPPPAPSRAPAPPKPANADPFSSPD